MTLPVTTKIKLHFVSPGGSPLAQSGLASAMSSDSNTKAHACRPKWGHLSSGPFCAHSDGNRNSLCLAV